MKKLITVILILTLILPAAASADDPDPIVGNWYFLYDKSKCPELSSTFNGLDLAISVYWFTENGIIYSSEVSVLGEKGTTGYSPVGKWEKDDSGYHYSIIGIGESNLILENDEMLLNLPTNPTFYMRIRRMLPFNPYQDYVIK